MLLTLLKNLQSQVHVRTQVQVQVQAQSQARVQAQVKAKVQAQAQVLSVKHSGLFNSETLLPKASTLYLCSVFVHARVKPLKN